MLEKLYDILFNVFGTYLCVAGALSAILWLDVAPQWSWVRVLLWGAGFAFVGAFVVAVVIEARKDKTP